MNINENNSKLRQNIYFTALIDIVREAGSVILNFYNNQEPNITYKTDQSPLTEADLMSHKVISSQLSSISQIPIISEESENIHTKSEIYWLIDPLDGTKEFISKNGEFTVNIALIENHFPLIGIVFHPVSGIAYIGGKNLGAIKIEETNEHKDIFVSGAHSPIRVVASRSHLNESTKNFIKELGSVTTIHSGSSLKLCLVAEGLADIYPRLAPTSEWDTAAAQAVVEGAGGSVLTLDGSRVKYQKENILNPDFIVRGANKLSV